MDELAPAAYAALIAPAIDRVFAETMLATRSMGGRELSESFGGPPAVGFLIDLRTRLGAGESVTPGQFAAVRRYGDLAKAREILTGQAERGMLTIAEDGTFRATDRGREFLSALYDLHTQVTATLWVGFPVPRLSELAGRALAVASDPATWAVTADGHALSAMLPVPDPSTRNGVTLLNRLGTLRYHRADAHAAAWQAAGRTAADMATLPVHSAVRIPIEQETNRGAAAPWTALRPAERLEFLAGLAALPCAAS
ncbi:MAG: hypothetical protein HOU81_26415 [Hamadaea sp.]|uniref:hypothetical protein n=1 Tax=Hamadaea sp. TaxID=2024425 RepID=UPI0018583846|nr:hypothetical protein [Hamadaea sp.]NUR74360.1 hypothetical protein [Hamadaea sp.]NUT21545.1 hypothetical protein [Hamadaea sp.]